MRISSSTTVHSQPYLAPGPNLYINAHGNTYLRPMESLCAQRKTGHIVTTQGLLTAVVWYVLYYIVKQVQHPKINVIYR